MHVTTNEREATDLKERKKDHMGGFGGMKRRRKYCNYNLKNFQKENNNKMSLAK